MHLPDPARLVAALAACERRLVMITTGGGSPAIPHLVTTPGASAVVLEAIVPSARAAVDGLLGGLQEAYCSPRTARRLAAAAWQRALRLATAEGHGDPAPHAVGAAVTASLRTTTPKRGAHRVCAAVQTRAATHVAELVLEKGARSRAEEEMIAAAVVLELLAEACGADAPGGLAGLRPGEEVRRDAVVAPPAWRELLTGERSVACGTAGGCPAPVAGGLVFPGSFDPLHDGHRRMACIAEEIAERPLAYELSVTNVDKPTLDYVEIRDRAAQFTERQLWLTRAATFVEKLDVFPESTFVVGADTYVRLADPKYYGGSAAAAAAAVAAIAERARGLVVFGRVRDGVFEDASHLDVPAALRDVAYFVSQREFRLDVSSTELRRRARAREDAACDG